MHAVLVAGKLSMRIFFLPLFCLALPATARPPVVQAPEPLAAQLTRYLPLTEPRDAFEREILETRLAKEGREILATEGYFSPQFRLTGAALDQLTLVVTPGPRARIETVDIRFDGPLPEARRQSLRAAWALRVGTPFRQEDWQAAKDALLLDLVTRDYPAARIAQSEAQVDAERQRVALSLTLASGPPYRFGALRIEGFKRYSPNLVARYNNSVKPGRAYSEEKLLEFQSNLENTPYFSSVFARLDLEAAQEEGDGGPDGVHTAPVTIRLAERAPHRFGLGAGISSNTGARVEMNFHSADLLHRALQFEGGVRLEQRKKSVYADIFLPPSHDQARYAFGALLERSDIQDLRLDMKSLGLRQTRKLGKLERTLALGYIVEEEKPAHLASSRNRALTLNSIWNWRQAQEGGLLAGRDVQIQVGGAIRPVSDQNFLRLYTRQQQALALGEQNTLRLRVEGGIVLAPSRKGIPQDFLFRAGGSGSVRGYGYQSLGVKEGTSVLGGRYLLTLSGELTHWFPESLWGIAAFVDLGNAGDDQKTFRLKTGYGLGARWKSPAGPLGIDLAYGDQWRLHFAFVIPF
jgi:translocation and assembly module TamA